ncbi:Arsenite resistance protein ArsB [Psilocybe cubensis]|uniref:Arsenite resistance protein ArsB n=2 Tax=Psilocybe cubensis TaxID=181762 RepID=A0ACB8GLV5_PSICU|nr:Arsenite resistance protein ArsB [Psilocybe cubensis]KAH9476521.1 Arsenite resistance protein ArsB [Psilocybe cubensis]
MNGNKTGPTRSERPIESWEGTVKSPSPFKEMSILDRLLTPFVLLSMILGVIIGEFAQGVREALDTAKLHNVSLPIAIGLIVMMWPILTKVQYEKLPAILSTSRLWKHIGISIVLNWIIGPFLMLGLAWATLPDLPTYRAGVIMVGLARCIAMVAIWNDLARGDAEYCAILVVINGAMQIVLFAPYSVLFLNVIGGSHQEDVHVAYGDVAISVLIYLGIPLAAGVVTRYSVIFLTNKQFFDKRFIPFFSPIALIGLLYTIIVLFAYQGHRILHDLGPVFRVFVPQILYFVIMWTSTFTLIYYLSRREKVEDTIYGYEMAVVQAFTAASNNFELAIAVSIAVYGVNSQQALAATIGPLTEVPVLLGLTWVALYFRQKLDWTTKAIPLHEEKA